VQDCPEGQTSVNTCFKKWMEWRANRQITETLQKWPKIVASSVPSNIKYFCQVVGWKLRSSLYQFRNGITTYILDSWSLKMRPICCTETSRRNFYYSLRYNPEGGCCISFAGEDWNDVKFWVAFHVPPDIKNFLAVYQLLPIFLWILRISWLCINYFPYICRY